jgi:uncharacterized protein YneF (UPF0154 family)
MSDNSDNSDNSETKSSSMLTIILIIVCIILFIGIIILFITNKSTEKKLNDKIDNLETEKKNIEVIINNLKTNITNIQNNKVKETNNLLNKITDLENDNINKIRLPILNSIELIKQVAINYKSSEQTFVPISPFKFKGQNGVSFSFWFNSTGSNTWSRILDFGNGSPSDNIIIFINNNHLGLNICNGNCDGVDTNRYEIIKDVNDNKLRHVTWLINTDKTWNVFLDGKLHRTLNDQFYPSNIIRKNNYLGKSNWPNDPYFNGIISDFRVYNRILSVDEISDIYNFKEMQSMQKNLIIYNNSLLTYTKNNLSDVVVSKFNDDFI